MKRCSKGTQRNKKTGKCEQITKRKITKRSSQNTKHKTKQKSNKKTNRKRTSKNRCPTGTRKNKKTGKCDKKLVKSVKEKSRHAYNNENKDYNIDDYDNKKTTQDELLKAFKDVEYETKAVTRAFRDEENPHYMFDGPNYIFEEHHENIEDLFDEKNLPDKEEICYNGYKLKKRLGEGTYGIVNHMCRRENLSDCKYAVKIQKIDSDSRKRILMELDLMKKLSDIGIGPKFISSWECDKKIYIVTDVWDGDLHGLISGKYKSLDGKQCIGKHLIDKLRKQINWFHDNGLVHGDIYPKNVLVKLDEQKRIIDVTLTDFGIVDSVDNYLKGKSYIDLRTMVNYHKHSPNINYFKDNHISDRDVMLNPMHLDEAMFYYLETKCSLPPSSPYITRK